MSVRVMTAVWAIDLPAGEKLVLLALADCANDEGKCWPGMKSLCAKTGKCERSLQGAIQHLCAAGHLTREEIPGKGCNYFIHPQATLDLVHNPRRNCTPAEIAPPQKFTQTPAKIAGKPSRTVNIEKKDKPSSLARARKKVALPENWEPKSLTGGTVCSQIVAAWQPGRIERELSKFRDHHLKTGARWIDWDAAWRTWIQRAEDFERPGHERDDTNPTGTALGRVLRAIDGGR